jgi:hypothetical protein
MTHTPGPWKIPTPWNGFSEIRGGKGELVFGLAAGSVDEKQPDEVCEANARLIAAAPDLLSIVERFVALPGGSWHPERHAGEEAELRIAARAAIAKAKGRTA